MAKMLTPIQKMLILPFPQKSKLILPLHKTEFYPTIPQKIDFCDPLCQKISF